MTYCYYFSNGLNFDLRELHALSSFRGPLVSYRWSNTDQSSVKLYHPDPLLYMYLSTGGVSEHETLGNVECYDPETDRWVVDVIPQMRYRRSGVGVAVLQGLLFAIGGYLEGKTSTDAVECYNPRTKRCVYTQVMFSVCDQ